MNKLDPDVGTGLVGAPGKHGPGLEECEIGREADLLKFLTERTSRSQFDDTPSFNPISGTSL